MSDVREFIQRRLMAFHADSADPRWSSYLLEELFASVVSQGGSVSDIFEELYSFVGRAELSTVMANLIKDTARTALAFYREQFLASDLYWLSTSVETDCSRSQAYFALYIMTPDSLTPTCLLRILQTLAGTPFWSEAVANLEVESENELVRELLSQWLAESIEPDCRPDVERLAKSRH